MALESAPALPGTDAIARGTIRGRLLAYLVTMFVCATVVLAFAARLYGQRAADLSFDRLIAASILAMSDTVGVADGQWDMDLPYAALDMLAMAPDDRVFYSLRSPDGALVTGYDDLPAAPPALRARLEKQLTDSPVFFDADYRGESTRFALAGRWVAGTPPQERAWLQVGQTRRARDAVADDITRTATSAIALLIVAALGLTWWSVRRALRPLTRLQAEIGARDASDLHPIATAVPAEMASAVTALNRFMARLANNLDTLRVFIADAAHQMRTPLAALRAQAQMALDEPDAAEQHRGLLAVERNAAQLTRLLNQLLADATVVHRGTLQHFGPVDLVRVAREALHEAVPRAEPRPQVHWHADTETAPLSGDALMLREALKNLVDNALSHGVPAGRAEDPAEISVRVEAAAPPFAWSVSVADRGPGIAPEEMALVFDRFGRGKGAAPGGAGLGLAIVHKVVDSHDGAITLLPRPGGGLIVRLDFPAACATAVTAEASP
ncbi:sensor histidine kinase [Xylophilus sp. GOD-11R]|uniref:sensor histidine kinase n=1 Tax=Xylophilus sp. GOD-11R TaxID=3089814 RepID=UPI00298D4D8D|nr:sensor histidine kinase [Xylophilus sp. GOD-11R]WPB59211.1 sensor histidine kinase [Xylophilus sp. GOD-11R]